MRAECVGGPVDGLEVDIARGPLLRIAIPQSGSPWIATDLGGVALVHSSDNTQVRCHVYALRSQMDGSLRFVHEGVK
jgi:hypothetical protein